MDGSKIQENLLSIYANHNFDQINDDLIASTFFPEITGKPELTREKMEILAADRIYLAIKEDLSDFKGQIEDELKSRQTVDSDAEVKAILFGVVLNRAISLGYKRDATAYKFKMGLLLQLIKRQFIDSGKWNKILSDHFLFVFPILQNWYSFFFSYTNRSALQINKRFETILSLTNVNNGLNLVARFVAQNLIDDSLPNAFIDEKEIDYGAQFKKTIDDAIKVSYTFVQLISKESFYNIGTMNWCQYEFQGYGKFIKDLIEKYPPEYQKVFNDNVFFFIEGESLESVKPSYLISDYKSWYNEIQERNHARFYSVQAKTPGIPQASNDFKEFSDAIHKIAKAIIDAKKRLIDAIPQAAA